MRMLLGAALTLVSVGAAAAMTICATDPGACGLRMCRFSETVADHHGHRHVRYDFRPCPTNPPRGTVSVPAAMSPTERASFCRRYPADCLAVRQPDGRTVATPSWIARPYRGIAAGGFVPP